MNSNSRPTAREHELVVQQVQNETLVYDLRSHRAHCLNATAASIWRRCDGLNSVSDISRLIAEEEALDVDVNVVWLGISELAEHDLLSPEESMPSMMNRCEVVKKMGATSLLAVTPSVVTIDVPNAIPSAVSCVCTSSPQCIAQAQCPSTTFCNTSGLCAP